MVRYQPPTDWEQWVNWLAAGLHGRSRWRLSLIIMGIVFARGRRTVTSWLRGWRQRTLRGLLLLPPAAGTQGQRPGRATAQFAADAVGDERTSAGRHRRFPDKTLRAESPRGRHPSQSHARPRRPEVRLRAHLGHVLADLASSLVEHHRAAVAGTAVRPRQGRSQDSRQVPMAVPNQIATGGPADAAVLGDRQTGRKNRVVGGRWGLCQASLLETPAPAGVVVVSRLRKDAALFDVPRPPKKRGAASRASTAASGFIFAAVLPTAWVGKRCRALSTVNW